MNSCFKVLAAFIVSFSNKQKKQKNSMSQQPILGAITLIIAGN